MSKFCHVCGSKDIHYRRNQDLYDCSTCRSVVTGLGEQRARHNASNETEYGLAAEQRRQLQLIATHSDELSKLRRKVDLLHIQRGEDPNFPHVLAQNFRKAQAQWATQGHAQEFCVYGSDGYQYSVRVVR